jgi:hypothetical protein
MSTGTERQAPSGGGAEERYGGKGAYNQSFAGTLKAFVDISNATELKSCIFLTLLKDNVKWHQKQNGKIAFCCSRGNWK